MIDYDALDKTNQGIKFEDEHFPAYLRLFKWKIMEVCIEQTGDEAFWMFAPVFEDNRVLRDLIQKIRDTRLLIKDAKPEMNVPQLDPRRFTDDDYKKACTKRTNLIETLFQKETRLVRRAAIENFFSKVLFNEVGVEIADRLLYKYRNVLYHQMHWKCCPEKWPARETFFEKFYYHDGPNKPATRCGVQLLDRVAAAARGNRIYAFFKNSQLYELEFGGIKFNQEDKEYEIRSGFINEVLDEGPQYVLDRTPDGEEAKKPAMIWNVHKTLLVIAAFPLFNVQHLVATKKHEDWYYNLLDAMRQDPHNRAALWFLHKGYEETLREKEKERNRERLLRLEGIDAENGDELVKDEPVRTMRKQPAIDASNFSDEIDHDQLQLRIYQEELVLPALRGSNVVIVAPTGSGKTEVAIYAALKHIEEREEKKIASRVVMLVPKIPLVGQQKDRFLKYCRGKYYVDGFHGSEKSSNGKGRKDEVLRAHVVIMTPQILMNMLQSVRESERLYVCDFSMIIFDEVHKTTGNHPYGEIARMVQDFDGDKPQVIGLTASLNVKATMTSDEDRMLGEIYKLLATLGATVLSTIQNPASIAELNKHVSKPDDSVVICQAPSDSESKIRFFIKRTLNFCHTKLVAELERLITKRIVTSFPQNFMRNTKRLNLEDIAYYESWLQQVTQCLNKVNSTEKATAQINVRYLKCVLEARGIVEVMPAYVAFDYLDEQIKSIGDELALSQFTSDFLKNRRTLDDIKHLKEHNVDPEIVTRLQDTLKHTFEQKPDSRAIIFVQQRATAERVCDFLNNTGILAEKGKGPVFGYVLGTNNQGNVRQTQQQQASVIEKFNNGKLKVIVATSVVEEGLDVATCNLIIKYNCSSGSAIQLTQQRGRARAKNSRSVLLVVSSKVNENENNALIAEKYMRQCVHSIQTMGLVSLANKVAEEKARIAKERATEKLQQENERIRMQNRMFILFCVQCNTEFCKSDSVKKLYSNYMITDPEVWNKFELEAKKRSSYINEDTMPLCTLKCACGAVAGRAYKQRGVYVPQIDVKAIMFADANNPEHTEKKSKWTVVESDLFYIAEVAEAHLRLMLNALKTSEKNRDKLRLLDCESAQLIKDMQEKENTDRLRREAEERKNAEKRRIQKVTWDSDEDEKEGDDNSDDDF